MAYSFAPSDACYLHAGDGESFVHAANPHHVDDAHHGNDKQVQYRWHREF
jgi:hypothetical protein